MYYFVQNILIRFFVILTGNTWCHKIRLTFSMHYLKILELKIDNIKMDNGK